MSNKVKLIIEGVSGALFILLIIMVQHVDVAAIGPQGTSIGLSHINEAFANLTGEHLIWYKITEVCGILAILVVAAFALLGFLQLIQRRSIQDVDYEIICLGGLYAFLAVLYVLFEKMIVNYRPIIMPDEMEVEASFPSSHTMLICVVMGSAIIWINRMVSSDKMRLIMTIICSAIMVITVFGRLICGVHWLTDIIGGVLISITLVSGFAVAISDE